MGVDGKIAPAVYCSTAAGVRGLVSIEVPGVALFQLLDEDESIMDQAMGLVVKAVSVDGVIVAVRGKAGCLIRRQGEHWQLGGDGKSIGDFDVFFQSSTWQAALETARRYVLTSLAPVLGLVS